MTPKPSVRIAVVFLDDLSYDWTIFADRVVIRGTIKLATPHTTRPTRRRRRRGFRSLRATDRNDPFGTTARPEAVRLS